MTLTGFSIDMTATNTGTWELNVFDETWVGIEQLIVRKAKALTAWQDPGKEGEEKDSDDPEDRDSLLPVYFRLARPRRKTH